MRRTSTSVYNWQVGRDTADVDVLKLDGASRKLLVELEGHPVRRCTNLLMEHLPDGTWSLVAKVPSPTGESRRNISIWLDENRVPSFEFGAWHSHADLWDPDPDVGLRRMLDYLERITDGEVLLAELPILANGLPFRVLDVTDRDEILDEVTAPSSKGTMKLFSWSGAEDVTLDELRNRVLQEKR